MPKWLKDYLSLDQILAQCGIATILMVLFGSLMYNMYVNDVYRVFRCVEYMGLIILGDFVMITIYKVMYNHQREVIKKYYE